MNAINTDANTITVKSDKDAQDYTFTLADTKTLLKVSPGAKDLKSAVRITSHDLQTGDRVDVRYSDADGTTQPIPARSVLLMSARELQQAHQQEAAEWQNSTSGSVTSIDPSSGTITLQLRSAAAPKTITVLTASTTAFTRYSPDTPATPAKSSLDEIHAGDKLRVIGDTEGDSIHARKIYSGAFRSVPATIVSVDASSNVLVVKDLRSKQTLNVTVTQQAMLRKLPPQVAAMLAHRVNGAPAAGSGVQGPATEQHAAPSEGGQTTGAESHPAAGGAPGMRAGGGDPSRMLEHLPAITLADLKAGDAVLLTVAETKDPSKPAASAVIAGVEPIFQSAAPRQGQGQQSFGGGDWSLDMGVPAQ